MDTHIEQLVDKFEARRIGRRELIASITALVASAGAAVTAQNPVTPVKPVNPAGPVAQGRSLNHVSLAVTDVEKSAEFYSNLLGLKVVSRPGNGGINLGLGTSFFGLYKLANPGTVNHCCIGVDDFDPDAIAAKLIARGIRARVDRNPANRTSGGDQLYFMDPDNTNVQLGANGYQG
jgi:catechol 2,3-dioxygenase-like lactoylglutathione lyase family enzyme